ncbi:anti-sigma-F factor Fin family protein [Natroniella sulfidigena]|uniref:anti-sigma-F factor Fin n=1 Tax=Natroniella sulfidigena TaxID=723921 RepID=UPI00200B3A42|nr:anti-sigma-F factor Fin [Natroniella sulfidigena]MCK8817027.1 anti-sigma-F factor Fin family protein [Natroniella sulfidigena]
MELIYKCPECQKIIDHLEIASLSEVELGFDILTEQEKEDIIKRKADSVHINVTCDECEREYDWDQLIYQQQLH